ncbi:hypothetical protein IWX58_004031 [Rubrivivax gelatinosus]|uniref:hypothetical protein n=2 Tax=Rubrivivax gelatinosus TaxID=28068 RepID=UPI0018CA610B|nr:hypothetical protein [Rubrivivax gelatinosus]MBG6082344.1 hypothetical protein [Rubrivivax gelatinosus]
MPVVAMNTSSRPFRPGESLPAAPVPDLAEADASVAGEEDPGAAVDDGAAGPPVPDVPVEPKPRPPGAA